MNDPKVHILLSTYNGSHYILEQLNSIFQQTYQNFTLFTRDDGSSDNTLALISQYKEQHPEYASKINILPNLSRSNLGYMESFWTLLQKCSNADIYSFCDQDDVWLPDKLMQGVKFLTAHDNSLPLLYFSSFYLCNEDLSQRSPAPLVSLPISFKDVLFYTPAFGFSIMINECLRNTALKISDRRNLPHDGWMQKLAAAFGKILYDPTPTAYYRRHGLAVTTENQSTRSLIRNWISHDILGSSMSKTHYVISRFYQEYASSVSEENQKILKLFGTDQKGLIIWWKRLTYRPHLRPTAGGRLALKICFFLNRY